MKRMTRLTLLGILVVLGVTSLTAADAFSSWRHTNDIHVDYRWQLSGQDNCYLEYRDSTVDNLGKGVDIRVRVDYAIHDRSYAELHSTRIIYYGHGKQFIPFCDHVTEVTVLEREEAR